MPLFCHYAVSRQIARSGVPCTSRFERRVERGGPARPPVVRPPLQGLRGQSRHACPVRLRLSPVSGPPSATTRRYAVAPKRTALAQVIPLALHCALAETAQATAQETMADERTKSKATVDGQIFARFDLPATQGSYHHRTSDKQHHMTPPPYFNVGVEPWATLLLMTARNIEIGGAGLSVTVYKSKSNRAKICPSTVGVSLSNLLYSCFGYPD